MFRKLYSIVLFLVLGSPFLFAQSEQEIKNTFFQGKKMYEMRNFRQAKMTLENFLNNSQRNDFVAYGHYFYALSALESKDYTNTIKALDLLFYKFPNWAQAEEAHFVLAKAYWEQGKWEQAEAQLAKIKQPTFAEDIKKMRKYYWTLASIDQLVKLRQQQPQNEIIADILWTKLAQKILEPSEKELFDALSKQLNRTPRQEVRKENQKKNSYQIAVVLPFKRTENDPNSFNRKSQYLLDFCEGMRIAQRDLDSLNIKINIQLFDTEQNNTKIQQLTESAALHHADLIIALETPALRDFANQFRIPVVNPLSTQTEANQTHFQFYPSLETQARKAFVFATDSFPNREVGIYYGTTKRDSLLATYYKQEVEKANGQVKFFKKIQSNSNTFNALKSNLSLLSRNGHLFVCTSETALAGNLLSALSAENRNLPIIATDDWLTFSNLNYEQLDNQRIYLIAPDYLDPLRPELEVFKKKYVQQTNLIPSKFGYLGYEIVYVFGKNLNQLGTNLRDNLLRQGYTEGKLLSGTNYYQNLDNQIVPIIQLREGNLWVIFK